MIIFLQYTLTDLRAFTDENPFVLVKPNWPSPTPYQQFVRGTGQVIQRRKRGLYGWVGENYICKIGKGVRFEKMFLRQVQSVGKKPKNTMAARL